ncbi:MAG: universal stress protein [Acidimicrobiia bacterium]|nr:universal stress protein [Acidimicrobiia bacterium]
MYSSIVVGTDGSETANVAVIHATKLAQAFGATLHIVHVFHPLTKLGVAFGALPIDVDEVQASLTGAAESVSAEAAQTARDLGVAYETHAVAGEPSDGLVAVAEAVGADLIVVGNHGMTGVRRVLGSVPNKISHHAPCSVLIVDTTTTS